MTPVPPAIFLSVGPLPAIVLTAAAASVLLAACAGEDTELPTGEVFVRTVDDEFSSTVTRIPAGATVNWIVQGSNVHNVFASDNSWTSSHVMQKGDLFSRTFTEPGVYPYFCTFHGTAEGGGMAGYILVGDEAQVPVQTAAPTPVSRASGRVLNVPSEFSTIQAAVDQATPGDLVLIAPGVYRESVEVTTPSIIIRGLDRNRTVLDGSPYGDRARELVNGVQVVGADGVAIENLTAHNYQLNGFYWTGVTGYRASYLTAYNNGDYGIYAIDSQEGLIEGSYASGHPDAGFYIGQCFPCRVVLRDVIAENNALGYSGTNAGGDLYILESTWRSNRAGIAPNTLDSELNPPHRETYIAGNLVIDNNSETAPFTAFGGIVRGNGIILAAGVGDVVVRNLVINHDRIGIVATSFVDRNFYFSQHASVRDNVVAGSGWADLALVGPWGPGNCFEGSIAPRTLPPLLESLHGCDGIRLPLQGDLLGPMLLAAVQAGASAPDTSPDWRTAPAPPPQPNMSDTSTAPGQPAANVFSPPELDAVPLPDWPAGTALRRPEVLMAGIPVSEPTFWGVFFGIYGYFLPIALYAAWLGLAFWDLARRNKSVTYKATWIAVVLLIPFFGVLAYLLFGRSHLPTWFRLAITIGAIGAYLLILAIGAAVGGLV